MAVDQATVAARVRAALTTSGMQQQELATRTGMDPTALSKALRGKRRFSSLEIALISEQTGTPVSLFLADDSAPPSAVRRLSARAKPDENSATEKALARVDELLEIERLLVDLGLTSPPSMLPLSFAPGGPLVQADELARSVRRMTGLGWRDIDELASWTEQELYIDVAIEPLPKGFDGLSVSYGEYRLVLVNSQISATRQRYTLAHEIGHLAAGDSEDLVPIVDEDMFSKRTPVETRANSFAASFLMPLEAMRNIVADQRGLTDGAIAHMLARFKVSMDALAFRLHNAGLTNAAGRDRIRSKSARRLLLQFGLAEEYQRQLQARNLRRPPVRMLSRALSAHAEGRVSVRVLSRLMQIPEQALLDEIAYTDVSREQEEWDWDAVGEQADREAARAQEQWALAHDL